MVAHWLQIPLPCRNNPHVSTTQQGVGSSLVFVYCQYYHSVSSKWPMPWLFQNCYCRTDFEDLNYFHWFSFIHVLWGVGLGSTPRLQDTGGEAVSIYCWWGKSSPLSTVHSFPRVTWREGALEAPQKQLIATVPQPTLLLSPLVAALPQPSQRSSGRQSFGRNKFGKEQTTDECETDQQWPQRNGPTIP